MNRKRTKYTQQNLFFWQPQKPSSEENQNSKIFWITKKCEIFFLVNFYIFTVLGLNNPIDAGHKLNVHMTFRRRPGNLLNFLCTFNLRPISTGKFIWNSVYCHCVKSVRIRTYCGPYFPAFALNKGKYDEPE